MESKVGAPSGSYSPSPEAVLVNDTEMALAGGSYLDIYHILHDGVSDCSFWKAKDQTINAILKCADLDIVFPYLQHEVALLKLACEFKEK